MKDLLLYILENITTKPEEINIEEKINNGIKEFIISTDPEDVGRVIGKNGRIIKAIRTIMRTTAIQQGSRVRVTVISDVEENQDENDDNTGSQEPQETVETETEEVEVLEESEDVTQSGQKESQTNFPQKEAPLETEDSSLDLDL